MPFTVAEFHDLSRILETQPEWRTELHRFVLTDELLALPEQMAELRVLSERRFQELTDAQHRTEAQIAELVEAQRRTDAQIAELTWTVRSLGVDVGDLKGKILESRYHDRAGACLGRIVRRTHTLSTDELVTLLDDAVDQGRLALTERDEVLLADVVVRGRRRTDDVPVYLVVAVSWGVGLQDVDRAVHRAALLSKLGTPALPVVAGETVTEAAAQLARRHQVWQVTDGKAVPPESSTASA